MSRIIKVTSEQASQIIETREPRGIFYLISNGKYVAIDNSSGNAWTEEFITKKDCIRYLGGVPADEIYESEGYKHVKGIRK